MTAPQILRVVVASPGDVAPERKRLDAVVAELNRGVAAHNGFRLELVKWEDSAFPGFHPDGPQGVIDPILRIGDADFFIGIFWKRFGTAVSDAGSGTEHEFNRAYEEWKKTRRPHILFYFKNRAFAPSSTEEATQLGQVIAFKERFPPEGLWWPFSTADDFANKVRNHMMGILEQLGAAAAAPKTQPRRRGTAEEQLQRINYKGLDFEGILSNEDDDELFSVAFSPEGTVAAGSVRKVFLWDQGRPDEPRVFAHDAYVYSVSFSHDGRWLACGGEDGTVRVYSVATGEERWQRTHGEAVYSVEFSHDDALIASGGYDRRVEVRQAASGRRKNSIELTGRVTSVAFAPNAHLLAIGDLDDTVTLWQYDDGDGRYELAGHTSSVETVAFSPDGSLLASGGLDKLVRVWDVETREPAWPEPGRGHEYLVRSVSFSPDGLTLASASWDKTIRLWDVETGRCQKLPWDELTQQKRWHSDWIWSVAFSKNGLMLATGGSDGKIVLLSIRDEIDV